MTAARVVSGIGAVILAIVGIPLLVIGSGLATFSSDATTTLPTIAVSSTERVLAFGEVDIRDSYDEGYDFDAGIDDITIAVTGSHLFLGIGPSDDVERFADSSSIPTGQRFWIAQASGDDPRLDFTIPDEGWSAVVMNADGTPGVDADISITIPSGPIRFAAGVILGAGFVTAGLSALLLFVAFRRQTPAAVARPKEPATV